MIFGWGRRNDGFEWHKYVRTTIKLRREDRRKKIDDIKDVAAERVKDASKAGLGAGRSAANGLATWTWHLLAMLPRLPRLLAILFMLSLRALLRALRPVGAWLTGLFIAVLPSLQRRGVAPILALIALASGASAAARITTSGIDVQATLAFTVAITMFVLAAAPLAARVTAHRSSVADPAVKQRITWPRLNARGLAALGVTVVVIAAGVALWSLSSRLHWPKTLTSIAAMSPFAGESVSGRARAITGDRLLVAGKLIRLSGIEAPELAQRCRNSRRRRWRCGSAARSGLARLVARGKVDCSISARDNDKQMLSGTCSIGKKDLAAAMASRGLAFAVGGLYAPYGGAERVARNAKKGIWSGEAQRPAEYRSQLWDRAKARAPDGCPIKGRVSRRGKVYILPWAPNYRRVRVRRSRGERWFCTESEAIAAGWRPDRTG